ncbi:MAG: hypothetical protein Q9170_003040 [Blastenia crenularia]
MDKELLLKSIKSLYTTAEQLSDGLVADDERRHALQQQLTSLKNSITTAFERVFEEICFQPHQSAAVRIALDGKWFEVLADGQPKTAQEIASVTNAEPELIARIMMVLTATNVVGEAGLQTYTATPVTQLLLDPGWANGLRHFFDHCGPSLINLPSYLERNGYKVPQDVKNGPFADAWGGRNTWALYQAEPKRGEIFNSFMTKFRDGTRMWTDIYPATSNLCGKVERSDNAVLLVDVGGGGGHVLKKFVKHPGYQTGRLILQDLPAALGDKAALKEQGIEAMAYDFFTPQPIKGAKAYYFRAILHDWPDRACREILKNTAAAMRKGHSKLLIDDMVLPDTNVPPRAAFFDLSMMALETGAERTKRQWHDLLESAGLRIEKIWSANSGLESVIEAELAP